MLRAFMAFQVLAPLVAVMACPEYYSEAGVHGILGAQAAVVGFWIALGAFPFPARVLTALPLLGWFAFILMLLPGFNGWIVLLLGLQIAVTVGIMVCARRSSHCVLTTKELGEEGLPWQFRIVHLLALMAAMALILGARYLPLVLALGFAAPPLIAGWAIFARGDPGWLIVGGTIAILLAVAVMAYTGYAQTGSIDVSMSWLLWCVIEAAFATLSFWWLKRIGFRVGRPLKPVVV